MVTMSVWSTRKLFSFHVFSGVLFADMMGSSSMQKQPTNNGRRLKDDTGDDAIPMFGSLLVDEKSLTPYSDATQVSSCIQIKIFFFK